MKNNKTLEHAGGTIANFQTKSFSVANTPEMIEILSKQIYTDPLLAVSRELLCNAFDAHQVSHTEKPIEVIAPDEIINGGLFTVKDFGTGLTEEEVLNLYTTYGASTKRDSNEFVGCLGIGSKSPFAVTSEFTVSSRVDGVEKMFHCFKQDGIPVCVKISEGSTDESNGLTVSVPIPTDSIQRFNSRLRESLQAFNRNEVKVAGLAAVEFFDDTPEEKITRVGEYSFRPAKKLLGLGYSSSLGIRMGRVIYKESRSLLDVGYCYGEPFIIEVPIGTVSISASREHIEDSVENVKVLKKILTDIGNKATQEALDSFSKIKTISSAVKVGLKYRGCIHAIEPLVKAFDDSKVKGHLKSDILLNAFQYNSSYKISRGIRIRQKSYTAVKTYVNTSADSYLLINDAKEVSQKKLTTDVSKYFRKLCKFTNGAGIYVFFRDKDTPIGVPGISPNKTIYYSTIQKYLSTVHHSRTKKNSKSPIRTDIMCKDITGEKEFALYSYEGVYALTNRGDIQCGEDLSDSSIRDFVENLKYLIKVPDILLVPVSHQRQINSNAIELGEFIKKNREEWIHKMQKELVKCSKKSLEEFKCNYFSDKVCKELKNLLKGNHPRALGSSSTLNVCKTLGEVLNCQRITNYCNKALAVANRTSYFVDSFGSRFPGVTYIKAYNWLPEKVREDFLLAIFKRAKEEGV